MRIASVEWQNDEKQVYVVTLENGEISHVPDDLDNLERREISEWLKTKSNKVGASRSSKSIVITSNQFYQQLSISEPSIITQEQAYQAATSSYLPDCMLALLREVPEKEQFSVKMKIGSAQYFDRRDPIVDLFRLVMGWTNEKTDKFFTLASKLL